MRDDSGTRILGSLFWLFLVVLAIYWTFVRTDWTREAKMFTFFLELAIAPIGLWIFSR